MRLRDYIPEPLQQHQQKKTMIPMPPSNATTPKSLLQEIPPQRLNKLLLQKQRSMNQADNDSNILPARKCSLRIPDLPMKRSSTHRNVGVPLAPLTFRRSQSLPSNLVPEHAGRALFWFRPDNKNNASSQPASSAANTSAASSTQSDTTTNLAATRAAVFAQHARRALASIPEELLSVPNLNHHHRDSSSSSKQQEDLEDSWTAELSEDGDDYQDDCWGNDDGDDHSDFLRVLNKDDSSEDLLGLDFVDADEQTSSPRSPPRNE